MLDNKISKSDLFYCGNDERMLIENYSYSTLSSLLTMFPSCKQEIIYYKVSSIMENGMIYGSPMES